MPLPPTCRQGPKEPPQPSRSSRSAEAVFAYMHDSAASTRSMWAGSKLAIRSAGRWRGDRRRKPRWRPATVDGILQTESRAGAGLLDPHRDRAVDQQLAVRERDVDAGSLEGVPAGEQHGAADVGE